MEQLACLLFLKMADEQTRPPFNFWLKDESLEDTENLPDPDVLVGEIVENLQAALEQFSTSMRNWAGSGRSQQSVHSI